MRPVSDQWQVTQDFAGLPTEGVVGNMQGSMVQVLVAMYGNYQPKGHAGTDTGCNVGTPVRAVRSGTVLWCDWDVNLPGGDWWGPGGYFDRWAFYKAFGGRLLVVQHAPGDLDVYAHLSAFKVSYGQFVEEGQLVALSGDSSAGQDGVLGPHLHTERIVDTANYSTGNGMIYGRIDPTTVWGINAQGNISPIQEEPVTPDDIKAIAREVWAYNNGQSKDAYQFLLDAPGSTTLAVWSYKNQELGNDDAFQILRNAVAGTERLAETVSAAAAKAAVGGADEAAIKGAVKEAITELLIAGAKNV